MTDMPTMKRPLQTSPGAPSAALRARIIASASSEPSATRSQRFFRHGALGVATSLLPILVFLAYGGIRTSPRPATLVLETAFGSASIALGVAYLALGRGRSMVGRPRLWLVGLALLTPILLLALKVLLSARHPAMMAEWVERPGFRCLRLSSVLCAAPLCALLWSRRNSDPTHPYAAGAALGAAVGAGAWVLVDLWCPVAHVSHLLLGHVLPLSLVIAFGALVGGRILVTRAKSASSAPH